MNPTLLKKLDPIARRIGLYTSYELDESEYIGQGPPGIVRKLLERGYETPPTFMGIPLAAAKEHPETGRVHDYSLRRIGTNPRMQYHIHLWYAESSKDLQIYSHYEFRPDFKRIGDETTGEMINRLRTHYSPEWGTSEYQQGVACDDLQDLLARTY